MESKYVVGKTTKLWHGVPLTSITFLVRGNDSGTWFEVNDDSMTTYFDKDVEPLAPEMTLTEMINTLNKEM